MQDCGASCHGVTTLEVGNRRDSRTSRLLLRPVRSGRACAVAGSARSVLLMRRSYSLHCSSKISRSAATFYLKATKPQTLNPNQ